MAYSRNDAISAIVNYKKLWDEANTAGNETDKKKAATLAQNIYGQMRANGDSSIADELSASDYAASQNVLKKYQQSQAATTSYNRDNAINDIIDYKKQWADADAAGDDIGKQYAANSAGSIYKAMTENGDSKIADELKASNYTQAQSASDKWHQLDKTATRPYFYSLGQKYGMTQEQVDALIGWDEKTGEVSFGGQNLGKPDYLSDGASYWSDTSVLDKVFNDYISRSGTTRSTEQLIGQNNDEINQKVNQLWGLQTNDHNDLNNKYKEEYDYITQTNPFTTDTAKAILAKYDLSGLQARDNAVAGGGASNGGNIDSYAAANALRQQSALINQGQMAVLDAHQQRIDNARSILESLGVSQQNSYTGMQNTIGVQQKEAQRLFENQESQAQRLFENEETAKNNETNRLVQQSEVTGQAPIEWTIKNNATLSQFLNPDGSFKKEMEGVDIQALINQAKANGNTQLAQDLAVVRARKIMGNYDAYGQYMNSGDIASLSPTQTEAARQFDKTDATTRHDIDKTAEVEIHKSNNTLEGTKYEADSEERIQQGHDEKDKYGYDKEAEVRIQESKDQLEGEKYGYDTEADTRKYEADAAKELGIHESDNTLAGIQDTNKTTVNVANIESNTRIQESKDKLEGDKYGYDTEADTSKYVVDNGGDLGIDLSDDSSSTTTTSNDSSTPTASKDIYTKWEDDGIAFTTMTVSGLDTNRLKSSGVDEYGQKAIEAAIAAVTNDSLGVDGVVSNYDLADFLVRNSDATDTNKNQLTKVFAYFGLDKNMLNQVENAKFGGSMWAWEYGTKYKD